MLVIGGLAALTVTSADTPRKSGKSTAAEAAKGFTVRVTDVKRTGGELVIAVFDREDGFPADVTKAVRTGKTALDQPEHTFGDLPDGEYVIVVFHDLNRNGKADRTALGFPKEPIGLSNHPAIGLKAGRPDFKKGKVKVRGTGEISINLIELSR